MKPERVAARIAPVEAPMTDAEKALRETHEALDAVANHAPTPYHGCHCRERTHAAINRAVRAAWLEPYERMGVTPEVEPDWLPKEEA